MSLSRLGGLGLGLSLGLSRWTIGLTLLFLLTKVKLAKVHKSPTYQVSLEFAAKKFCVFSCPELFSEKVVWSGSERILCKN